MYKLPLSVAEEVDILEEIVSGALQVRPRVNMHKNEFALRCIPPLVSFDYGFELRLNEDIIPHARIYLRASNVFSIDDAKQMVITYNSGIKKDIQVLIGRSNFINHITDICAYLTPPETNFILYEDGSKILFESSIGGGRMEYEFE